MERQKILIGSGYMDLYVNREKYESYKTSQAANLYVYKTALKCVESILYTNIGGTFDDPALELRHVKLDQYMHTATRIDDLGYSGTFPVPECSNKKVIPVRIFGVQEIVALVLDETIGLFHIKVKKPSFIFKICGYKLV